MTQAQTPYIIVSDGACSGNPGPGGWGLIFVTPSKQVKEFGGQEAKTTNNRMELMGFYRGLQEVHRAHKHSRHGVDQESRVIRAISDSKYVLDNFELSLDAWENNGWMTSAGTEVKNKDIWERVLKGKKILMALGFRFDLERVKGHGGHDANERVDQIAVQFSKNEAVELFEGPLARYEISLEAGEEFEPVYLAILSGRIHRFKTWDECKAKVEGKQGVKYKKVTNRLQEKETLKSWGKA